MPARRRFRVTARISRSLRWRSTFRLVARTSRPHPRQTWRRSARGRLVFNGMQAQKILPCSANCITDSCERTPKGLKVKSRPVRALTETWSRVRRPRPCTRGVDVAKRDMVDASFIAICSRRQGETVPILSPAPKRNDMPTSVTLLQQKWDGRTSVLLLLVLLSAKEEVNSGKQEQHQHGTADQLLVGLLHGSRNALLCRDRLQRLR